MNIFDKMNIRKQVEQFSGESFYRYGKTMSAMFRKGSYFYSFVQTPGGESSLIRTDNNTAEAGNKYTCEVFTIVNGKILVSDQLTIEENSLIGNIARSCNFEITNIYS